MVQEIRCSNLHRPMSCYGSVAFTSLDKENETEPARQGTAAGEWLQRMIETQNFDNLAGTPASNGYIFESDMLFYLRPIAEEILGRAQSKVLCEQRIDWQTRSGITIRGQYDASYVEDDMLCVDDLKYGWGIVEPRENWQLLGYGVGEILRRQTYFPRIRFRIIQPRPHHEKGSVREWIISYEELCQYKEKIEQRMYDIAGGRKDLVTGKQCRYCPAAAEACPAFGRSFYRTLETTLEDHVQDSLNNDELSFQLTMITRAEEILKIKKDSIRQLAIDRIKEGKTIPGWSTEASYSDRKWKPEANPKTIEIMTGKKIFKEEVLSPAQAEKIGIPKEIVSHMTNRHFLGMKLVPKDPTEIGNSIFGTEAPKQQ